MAVLETLAKLFYDPYVFWGAPLALAVAWAGVRRWRRRRRGRPPGRGPGEGRS